MYEGPGIAVFTAAADMREMLAAALDAAAWILLLTWPSSTSKSHRSVTACRNTSDTLTHPHSNSSGLYLGFEHASKSGFLLEFLLLWFWCWRFFRFGGGLKSAGLRRVGLMCQRKIREDCFIYTINEKNSERIEEDGQSIYLSLSLSSLQPY